MVLLSDNISYNFMSQAWQLSILADIPEECINSNLLHTVKWMHLCEFIFLAMSFITVIFTHLIIFKNIKIRTMHSNIKLFFHHSIGIFYLQQICRFILFVIVFSGCFTNISIYSPFMPLHIIRESCLMVDASAFIVITIDRYIATRNPEKYEQQKRPYIASTLFVIIWIYVIVLQVLRYTKTIALIWMPILIAVGGFVTFPILVYVYKKNKYYLNFIYTMTLNSKFQIRENIRLILPMIPGAILFTCGIFGIAAIFTLVYYFNECQEYDTSLFLMTIVNLGLQILFLWASLSFSFLIPVMREHSLNFLCGKPIKTTVQKITPMHEEKDVYFNQFQTMWKTNSSRTLGNVRRFSIRPRSSFNSLNSNQT